MPSKGFKTCLGSGTKPKNPLTAQTKVVQVTGTVKCHVCSQFVQVGRDGAIINHRFR